MAEAVATATRDGVGKATLARAQSLLQAGALEEARRLASELTSRDPDDADALYIRAVCERYAGDLGEALATLDRLRSLKPGYGRAWQVSKVMDPSSQSVPLQLLELIPNGVTVTVCSGDVVRGRE